jgi:predicted nucleotidyltransferase
MRHGQLKNIFDTLERSFAELGIDFYLIGALARQVWYEKGSISFRTTKDIDYAALVSSQDEYQRIREYLIVKEKFTPYRGNAFVLIAPDGTQVDILPFGEIEDDGSVTVSGQGMTSIRVDGLIEVYNSGTEDVNFETGHLFKVATLPAIALLKFIA